MMKYHGKASDIHPEGEEIETADNVERIEMFDVMHYSRDRKGRKNYIKIGRAWGVEGGPRIRVKLYAWPLPNPEGEVFVELELREAKVPNGSGNAV